VKKINEYSRSVTSLSVIKIILKQAKAPALQTVGMLTEARFSIGKSQEYGRQNKLED